MELSKLDDILIKLKELSPVDISEFDGLFSHEPKKEFSVMVDLLIENGYLVRSLREEWIPTPTSLVQEGYVKKIPEYRITPSGILFIKNGGYQQDDNYRAETLQVAKQSRDFAKWALWVSILGIIVSIILFLIQK